MNNLKSLWITALVALIVTACGGGGGSTTSSTAEPLAATASVAIAMTDSSTPESDELLDAIIDDDCDVASTPEDCVEPPETCGPDSTTTEDGECADKPQLLVTVVQILLLGDSGKEEIFSGEKVVDLFDLKEGLELMFQDNDVTPGSYEKIRLIVAGEPLLLSPKYPEGADVKLPGNKIDLNPRGAFRIEQGDTVLITLDWHANKSLKLKAGPNLMLRPVIFVDVEIDGSPDLVDRIVRVSGSVGDKADNGFEPCMNSTIQPVILSPGAASSDVGEEPEIDDCIDVIVTDKTGLFDENGEPETLATLMSGDPVTVIGLLRPIEEIIDECDEAAIPENECAIDEPLTVVANSEPGDYDSDSDNDDSIPERRFEIIAAVVEGGLPGTWDRFRGTLETAADGLGEFDFRLAGTEGRLLIGKVYAETRILLVSKEDGIKEITAAELAVGNRAIVEAVFVPGDDTGPTPKAPQDCDINTAEECPGEILDGTLRISIMLVTMGDEGIPPTLPPGVVGGKLLSVDIETGELMVAAPSGDRCVLTDEETIILQIVINGDDVNAAKAELGDLVEGSLILASGTDDACLNAAVVISEGPAAPEPEA